MKARERDRRERRTSGSNTSVITIEFAITGSSYLDENPTPVQDEQLSRQDVRSTRHFDKLIKVAQNKQSLSL